MAASTSDCSGCLTVSTICCTGFTAAATTPAAPPAAAPSVVHCSSEAFSNGFPAAEQRDTKQFAAQPQGVFLRHGCQSKSVAFELRCGRSTVCAHLDIRQGIPDCMALGALTSPGRNRCTSWWYFPL